MKPLERSESALELATYPPAARMAVWISAVVPRRAATGATAASCSCWGNVAVCCWTAVLWLRLLNLKLWRVPRRHAARSMNQSPAFSFAAETRRARRASR